MPKACSTSSADSTRTSSRRTRTSTCRIARGCAATGAATCRTPSCGITAARRSARSAAFAVFHGQRNLEWVYLKNTPALAAAAHAAGTPRLQRRRGGALRARSACSATFLRAQGRGAWRRCRPSCGSGRPSARAARSARRDLSRTSTAAGWRRRCARSGSTSGLAEEAAVTVAAGQRRSSSTTTPAASCAGAAVDRRRAGGRRWEAVVVDNASSDGSGAIVAAFAPHARVVRNARTSGSRAASTRGWRRPPRPTVLIMNPDCRLVQRALWRRSTANCSATIPTCAIVGPRILNPDGSVQGSARGDPDMLTGLFGRTHGVAPGAAALAVSQRNVVGDEAIGAAASIDGRLGLGRVHARAPRARWSGSTDSTSATFLYWEDADLCRRLRGAGLPRPLRARRDRRSPRRPLQPHGAAVSDPRVPRERLSVLLDARRADARLPKRLAARVLLAGDAAGSKLPAVTPLSARNQPRDLFANRQARRSAPAIRCPPPEPGAGSSGPSRPGNQRTTRQEGGASAGCRCRRAGDPRAQFRQQRAPARGSPRRDPVRLVVVLSLLEADGRAERDVAVDGLRRGARRAHGRCVRQRIDQARSRAAAWRAPAPRTRRGTDRSVNASPPSAADTSSAYRPAALTTARARMRSAGVRSSMRRLRRTSAPISGVPGRTAASCSVHRRASVRTSASASRMPVFGENSAAVARTCGSRARMNACVDDRAALARRSPRPRACSALERLDLVRRARRRSACRSGGAGRRAPRRTRRASARPRRSASP